HDIGKYSDAFQDKIKNNTGKQVDHSTAGMKTCFEEGRWYPFLGYCIAGHHAGMPDCGGSSDTGSAPTLEGRKKKKIEIYDAYKSEIEIPELSELPFDPQKTSDPDFSISMLLRMIYSCLVDADFLDTESFMSNGEVQRDSGEKMEILLERLETYIT